MIKRLAVSLAAALPLAACLAACMGSGTDLDGQTVKPDGSESNTFCCQHILTNAPLGNDT